MTLTARQSAIVAFIRAHVADHGYPPTVRDIAAAVGLVSPSHASGNLKPGCPGYWVIAPTGDPGQDWTYPAFTQTVRPAVIGTTVCTTPRFSCFCGLAHVTAEELTWLPKEGDEPWAA